MKSSPLKKLARSAQYVGAGIAAWRLNRANSEANRSKAERHLAQRLGRLRGLPQKIGQLMSMGDIDGEQGSLTSLRAEAEPLSLELLMPVLEDIWGRNPDDVFSKIAPRGLAASLGQVHRATLVDGREVAIKIQYPEIAQSIETDLRALGWLSKPVGNLRGGFDMDAYGQVIRAGLEEELDYAQEAHNQESFRRLANGLGVVVPEVIGELSGAGVLTTAWEDGDTLDQVAREWNEKDRSLLGRKLVEQFLEMGLQQGLLHADPHPGNYRFRLNDGDPQVVLYDFGSVCRLEARERDLLLCLMAESVDPQSATDPFPLMVALGFDGQLLEPLRHKLPALCRILFEPFAAGGKYNFEHWQVSDRLEATLGSDRMNFRISGPAKMVPFLRAFTGLVHVIKKLDVPVFWSGPFRKLLAKSNVTVESLELPSVQESQTSFAGIAKVLRIRVIEGGEEKVSLAMPASSVDRLGELLEDELMAKIEQRKIDIDALVQKVRENLYAPQELFTLDEGPKRIVVGLE